MDGIAADGVDIAVSADGQDWRVGWYPPPDPPPGTPHGAQAICVTGDRIILISADGQHWGLPGGRPEPGERWVDTLRREICEETCATVTSATLLGFTRGTCMRGPEQGLVLVRSVWRAAVRLDPWAPRFEIAHRWLVPAASALRHLMIPDGYEPIFRRMFMEAAIPAARGLVGHDH